MSVFLESCRNKGGRGICHRPSLRISTYACMGEIHLRLLFPRISNRDHFHRIYSFPRNSLLHASLSVVVRPPP